MFESLLLKQEAHETKPISFKPKLNICFIIRTILLFLEKLVKLVIMLHEFFINICIAMAYSEKYTYKASQNLNTFKSVISVGVLCRF